MLLRVLGYNHLTSRTSSRDTAMINLIPLFAVPHLSTLADLLGVTLSTFRQIHPSAGVMAVALTIFHVLVMVASQPSFPLDLSHNQFAVIVSNPLGTFLR